MKISTKGRYALRVMIELALHDAEELVPLKEVAKRQGITLKYMEQIISPLAKAGYVQSLRGSNGGYRLAKKPSEYKAGDILRVMEGPLEPVVCLEDGYNCPRTDSCSTLEFWQGLSKLVNDYVDSYTLEDLAEQSLAKMGDYSI